MPLSASVCGSPASASTKAASASGKPASDSARVASASGSPASASAKAASASGKAASASGKAASTCGKAASASGRAASVSAKAASASGGSASLCGRAACVSSKAVRRRRRRRMVQAIKSLLSRDSCCRAKANGNAYRYSPAPGWRMVSAFGLCTILENIRIDFVTAACPLPESCVEFVGGVSPFSI